AASSTRFASPGRRTGSKVIRRWASVFPVRTSAAVSSALARRAIAFPALLLILLEPSSPEQARRGDQQRFGLGEERAVALVDAPRSCAAARGAAAGHPRLARGFRARRGCRPPGGPGS